MAGCAGPASRLRPGRQLGPDTRRACSRSFAFAESSGAGLSLPVRSRPARRRSGVVASLGLAILGQFGVGVESVRSRASPPRVERLVVGPLGELEPFAVVPRLLIPFNDRGEPSVEGIVAGSESRSCVSQRSASATPSASPSPEPLRSGWSSARPGNSR